jgi:hypothetical protein
VIVWTLAVAGLAWFPFTKAKLGGWFHPS